MSASNWPEFWKKLEDLYLAEDGNLEAYEAESPVLRDAITAIAGKLDGMFTVVEPIGRGGAGIVLRLLDEHMKIDRALKRIAAGTYGICERCGKPIEKARIKALPYVDLCIKDARAQSRR